MHRLTRRTLLAAAAGLMVSARTSFGSGDATDAAVVKVTKDPDCGCCAGWVEHLKASGFRADVIETRDLAPVKARLGVPAALASCHTAEVSGYVIEGHVPAAAIRRLLAERPAARGLAVPGMPVGSPGMEVPGSANEPYEVVLFGPAGQQVFARYAGTQER